MSWTIEQYRAHLEKNKPKKNKFNARITIVDGIKFASKWEAERYQQLKLLLKAGEIFDLELQPKFELQEKNELNGDRAIHYIADFRYKTGAQFPSIIIKDIVEDTKSTATMKQSAIDKHKMFRKKFPHLELRLLFKQKNTKRGRPRL